MKKNKMKNMKDIQKFKNRNVAIGVQGSEQKGGVDGALGQVDKNLKKISGDGLADDNGEALLKNVWKDVLNGEVKIGEKLEIHCYKHNGHLHRQWDEAVLLDVQDDYMVFGNNRTVVIDSDGKVWNTKEPAIMFFFKDRWFNVIGQFKDYGIYFYCNIATPFLIDEKVIKYIDYDLDLRVFPNGSFKVLDRMEYKFHKKQMHYSNRLDFILRYELGSLIEIVRKKEFPFDKDTIERYYKKYRELTDDEGALKE